MSATSINKNENGNCVVANPAFQIYCGIDQRRNVVPRSGRGDHLSKVGNVSEPVLAVFRDLRWSRACSDSHDVVLRGTEAHKAVSVLLEIIVQIDTSVLGQVEVPVEVEIETIVWPTGVCSLEPGRDVLDELAGLGPPQSVMIVLGDQAQ